jgi:hypothetical protein
MPRFRPRLDPMEDRTLLSTLTVMNDHDSGPGSLRAAIAAASSGDAIKFAKSLKGQTIALTTGGLEITTSLDIDGPGAGRLTVSGDGASRVFETAAGLDVTISGLTITDGSAPDQGGGIANLLDATTTVTDSTITRNEANGGCGGAGLGGAAYNDATSSLALEDALVILNVAAGAPGIGGGVYTLGTFSYDAQTLILFNHASTSGDNIGP